MQDLQPSTEPSQYQEPSAGTKHCFHCDLPIPKGVSINTTIGHQKQDFCCYGCQIIAKNISSAGLENFYAFRDTPSERPTQQIDQEYLQFDEPSFQNQFVKTSIDDENNSILEAKFIIEGITCAACVWLIETQLKRFNGVKQATINLTERRLFLQWDSSAQLSELVGSIAVLGYRIHPYKASHADQLHQKEFRKAILRLAVAAIGMMQVMMHAVGLYSGEAQGIDTDHMNFLRWISAIITTPIVLYSAFPFFTNALRGLKARHLNMDVPISIAISGAYSASLWSTLFQGEEVYFDSVTMFIFFLLLGRFLEMLARHRSNHTISNLMRLNPDYATLINPNTGQHTTITVDTIQKNNLIFVKPGEHIPADGIVIDGESSVTEAMLTGEFDPKSVSSHDDNNNVLAGSQNISGSLTIKVTETGEETMIGSVMQLLAQAQNDKPRVAILADRIAHYFIFGVLLFTSMTYLAWQWYDPSRAFWVALAVLVATCPCALSLATPTVITVTLNRLIKHGFVLTKPNALHYLSETTDFVFDKTGTLTSGEFSITKLEIIDSRFSSDEILTLCAALERDSLHPIATAFQNHTNQANDQQKIIFDQLKHKTAQGIEGIWQNHLYRLGSRDFALSNKTAPPNIVDGTQDKEIILSRDGSLIAIIYLADTVRTDANTLTQALTKQHVTTHIITGDQQPGLAKAISNLPDIQHYEAKCTPERKKQYLKQLSNQGRIITSVGDGINDTPILKAAHFSIAMGSGADLAKVHADAVLLNNNLLNILYAKRISGLMHQRIKQNICWAIGYNLTILPLAACGLVAPYIAAIGMSLSSLLVVLNANRIR